MRTVAIEPDVEVRALKRKASRARRAAAAHLSGAKSAWPWAEIVARRLAGEPQRLAAAVLMQALRDRAGLRCTRKEQHDAILWLSRRRTMQPGSFSWCCFVLELDPDDVLSSSPLGGNGKVKIT